jgi:hypothetical protein
MKSLHLLIALPAHLDASQERLRLAAPSLFKLLKRGQTIPSHPSLTGALCQAFDIKQQQDWPLAPICAMAEGYQTEADYWLRLDPVHLEVVMGGLILRPSANLQLSMEEANALITDINLHWLSEGWQKDGWKIQATSPTRWYLRLPEAPKLRTAPLDQMAGEYLTPNLPRDPDARLFLNRINEVQMLMHSHSVNLAREEESRPVVNGLWLWGGGTLSPSKKRFDLCAGDQFELQALAQAAGSPFSLSPVRLSDLSRCNDALIALTQPMRNWDGNLENQLAQLEQNWFAPLLKQLTWGRIQRLRLDLIGYESVNLSPSSAWRFWQ